MKDNDMRNWLRTNSGLTYGNYIDGEWTASTSNKTYPLYESALPGLKLGDFADSSEEDVNLAVQAADKAFRTWRKTPAPARAAILYRFADLLEKNREELAYVLSAEQGKVLNESLGEIQRAANEARYAAGEAFRVEGQTLPSENEQIRSRVLRHPIGVVAAIAPWNFPIVTPVRKIAPALAYGCTVVLKPASATPWSAIKVVELLVEAGLPKGVVNLLLGSGNKVGDPLVAHPLVKGISFTGSTELGLRINGLAASRLAKTQLEMGGKNAALVLDYDNLPSAADQIVSAAFTCSGQRCTAISRVIVLPHQAEALTTFIRERMDAIHVGPAWAENVNMGPLLNKRHYETVMSYVESGKLEGAKLVAGGGRLHPADTTLKDQEQGYFMAPTLFSGVSKDMRIASEEIFGPVLVVMVARDIQEALELANATEYGLATSVFTNRLDIAHELTEAIDSGMIHINHGTASQAHMPFGGMKKSGFGSYSIGHSNQEFFTGIKAVYIKGQ
jgi:acyl-CoA reductase-like NAD-dependent aldehyde dehydrogenase